MKPQLVVTPDGNALEATRKGDTGMCIVGRGLSVAEAVGMWCIFSGLVEVRCDPPELLERMHLSYTPHRGRN